MNENVEFKMTKSEDMRDYYNIDCIYTERPENEKIRCVSVLKTGQFAEYMLEIIKNHWKNHGKILRFSYKFLEKKIINQYEYRNIRDLDTYFKEYQKNKGADNYE